jgi:hypothetical protein
MSQPEIQLAMSVSERYQSYMMQKANVVGVGVGYREKDGKLSDEVVLVVNVTRKLPSHELLPEDLIPREIEGVPVDVRETGEIRGLDG